MIKKKKPTVKRRLISKIKKQRLYDPNDFLSPRRIDLTAKVIFARAYLEGNTSGWPEFVYREHLRAFNNFYEEEPIKQNYKDFKESFIKTIEGVGKSDDWKHEAPVEGNGNFLMNGAHRAAASIVLGDVINVVPSEAGYEHNWGYNFFRSNRGEIDQINEDVLDYMTIEYVSLKKKNIFIAVIFPAAEGHRKEAYEHFLKLGEIVNVKTFHSDEFIGKEVIKQLYFDSRNDTWNRGIDFEGAKRKAEGCFKGIGDLQVYVIEANLDETTRIKEKQYLRNLWGKEKHSIHITDTMEEANRVVRMFFNENSRRFMKVDRKQEFSSKKMYDMFSEYVKLAPEDIVEREKIAIEGSAVLDLLNIRAGRDIDYISRDESINFSSETIEKHDKKENSYHSQSIDEIITNPKYYFYYKGYKFVDILEILNYKQSRSAKQDIKDMKDTKYIKQYLRSNPYYGIFPENEKPAILSKAPLFSVIVPLYNKERYLAACLENIQHQTEEDWECIVINDGSTDESEQIAKAFADRDPRFRLFTQKNAGPSAARNRGIKEARGKILHFLDADDFYPDVTTLKQIGDVYKKERPKAIAGKIGVLDIEGEDVDYDVIPVNSEKVSYQSFSNLQNDYFFTRFFFDRKFILDHKIEFPEYTYVGEDPVFLVKALSRMDTFLVTNIPTYVYNTMASHNNKLSQYSNTSIVGYMDAQIEILEICSKNGYHDLAKRILDRVDYQMRDIYFEKAVKSKIVKSKLTELYGFVYPELYYERILSLRDKDTHIQNLETIISGLLAELEQLRMPSVKVATRKFAGSVKRKAKRTLARTATRKNG